MRNAMILASMAAMGLCAQALAKDEISYSYLEAGYISGESGGIDGDGLNAFGSLAFAENAHLFGSFSDQEFDNDVETQFFQLGAGLNWTLGQKVDLLTRLSYVDLDIDLPGGGSASDDGYALGFGLRTLLNPQFELSTGYTYTDLDLGGENTQINLGGRYYLNDQVALGLDLLQDDSDSTYILGARYEFGQ
jgi:hypothetical protein